jgi:hypothetical protein
MNVRARQVSTLGAIIALAGLLGAKASARGDNPRVSVQLDACVQVDQPLFRHSLDTELALAVDYSGDQSASNDLTSVRLTCVAAGVQLDLHDNVTGKSMARVVVLDGIAENSRSRLLALSVAEFVAASWIELRVYRPRSADGAGARTTQAIEQRVARFAERHPVQVAEPAPAATAQAREERPEEPTPVVADSTTHAAVVASDGDAGISWRSRLALEAVKLASISGAWLGAEVAAAARPWPRVELGLGLQLGRTSFHGSLDGQPIPQITLTFVSAALELLFVHELSDLDITAGIGMRSGFALLGVAASPLVTPRASNVRLSHVPMALLGMNYELVSNLRLGLKLEVGHVLHGLDLAVVESPGTAAARKTSVAAFRGVWAGLALGLAWVF